MVRDHSRRHTVGDTCIRALAYTSRLATGFESYVRRTVEQLQPASHYGLWTCLYSAVQTRLDYWLQHLPPVVTRDMCDRVDAALVQAVERITYVGALATQPDHITELN